MSAHAVSIFRCNHNFTYFLFVDRYAVCRRLKFGWEQQVSLQWKSTADMMPGKGWSGMLWWYRLLHNFFFPNLSVTLTECLKKWKTILSLFYFSGDYTWACKGGMAYLYISIFIYLSIYLYIYIYIYEYIYITYLTKPLLFSIEYN